jgi:hypothetical protein
MPSSGRKQIVTRSAEGSSPAPTRGGGRAGKALFGALCACLLALAALLGSGASAVAAEGCANEAVRAENNSLALPECRAYEMVSARFKSGFAATPTDEYLEDGSAYMYKSQGGFAGAGAANASNAYFARRTPDGWATSSLAGSGPAYASDSNYKLASADLTSSLWNMRHPEQSASVQDMYLRRPDGTFALVGPFADYSKLPLAPPGPRPVGQSPLSFAGSRDLAHFIFTIEGQFAFPGESIAPTAALRVLYEYSGIGNAEANFVGLDNDGDPVSHCETWAGSSTSTYRDISEEGRVVFFTPKSKVCPGGVFPHPAFDQVWARLGGVTSVEASASLCTRTAADPGGACNPESAATFQGADNDGSRVFFTTAQQLLNQDTDTTNDLYECDIPAGVPVPVGAANSCAALREVSGAATEANVQGVVRISEDGSTVYFVAKGVLASNPGVSGLAAVAGDNNLYVWRTDPAHPDGQTAFVAKLAANDTALWGGDSGREAQTSPDGTILVFSTFTPLIPSGPGVDADTAKDVYRYDVDTGRAVRVSVDTEGAGGNGAGNATIVAQNFISGANWRTRTAMDTDGDAIAFQTPEALSPADTNDASDVYLWHAGHVFLISPGTFSEGAEGGQVTADGLDVTFITNQAITPEDGDTITDIYDARVLGGFAHPAPPVCIGEECAGPPSPSPSAGSPGTDKAGPAGNVVPASASLAKLGRKQRHRLESGARGTFVVTVNGPGRVSLKAMGGVGGKRKQVLGSSVEAEAAGQLRLRARLSKSALAQLHNRGRLRMSLTLRFADAPPATRSLALGARTKRHAHHAKKGEG